YVGMEQGFLSQKGSEVGRGVKGKQVLWRISQSRLAYGIHSHASAKEENINGTGNTVGPTSAGTTRGMSSYAVTGELSRKALNF
nr:hypothetical protein [Tanacetum cinerariifolium]